MKVELAKSAGFCFGVEKAVNTVYEEGYEKKRCGGREDGRIGFTAKGHGDYPLTWSQ